jgi:hypothetical protein
VRSDFDRLAALYSHKKGLSQELGKGRLGFKSIDRIIQYFHPKLGEFISKALKLFAERKLV